MQGKKSLKTKAKHGKGMFLGQVSLGAFADVGRQVVSRFDSTDARIYLSIEVGEKCQLQCRHCIYHGREPAFPRPNKKVLDAVSDGLKESVKADWISFSGKEPTIYKKELLELARKMYGSADRSILMTNGLLLEEKLLRELGEYIDYFDISLDGTQQAHDWMRGAGTFQKAWENIHKVLEYTDSKIGLIATAVHARLNRGERQLGDIVALANLLAQEFGLSDRISLSISLYYGKPDDKFILTKEDVVWLARSLSKIDFKTRILVTSNYASYMPFVFSTLALDANAINYDKHTGIAVLPYGNLDFLLFNLSAVEQYCIRISHEGNLFLGCDHLVLGEDARRWRLGSLESRRFSHFVNEVQRHETGLHEQLGCIPDVCRDCEGLSLCGAGDRLSGLYFREEGVDPFCERVRTWK